MNINRRKKNRLSATIARVKETLRTIKSHASQGNSRLGDAGFLASLGGVVKKYNDYERNSGGAIKWSFQPLSNS